MRIMTLKKIAAGMGIAILMIAAGIASLLTPRLAGQFGEGEIPAPAPTTIHCPFGNAEDSCDADYIGDGNWALRKGADQ